MFDTALLESRRSPRGRGKGASLPLAIGLHVAVVGAFVGAAVWNTGEPPEPVTPVVFFPFGTSLPKPPGVPDRGPHAAATSPRSSATIPDLRIIPDQTPEPAAISDPATSPLDDIGSGETGPLSGNGGSPTGVVGGVGDGEGEPGSVPGEILPVGGDVRAPILSERVEPEYPEAARRARMEGVVILEAVILASGEVNDVRVLKSVNPLLDAAAERAVRQWRYRPATLNGRAVNVYLTVTVTFGLKS